MPNPRRTPRNRAVAVLAYPGLCLFEYATALELLANSPDGRDWYALSTCTIDGKAITADRGARITPDAGRAGLLDAGTIIVPGWSMAPVPDALATTLAEAHARGARIAAICTGAFALAAAGLLDGKRATTHWRHAADLARDYPAVRVDPDVLYIDEGSILTSAGSAAGIDMLLHLVRRDFGAARCNAVARGMVVPPHREGGQAQYVATAVPPAPGSAFSAVIERLRSDPAADHRIEDLAAMAAMSPRTFFRRFRAATGHTPYEWLLRERTRIAKTLLEESDLAIDRIAEEAGFGAPDTFRHHFRRVAGTTPSRFRAMFRNAA